MPARHTVGPSCRCFRVLGLGTLIAAAACGSDHKAAPPPAQTGDDEQASAASDPPVEAAVKQPKEDPERAAKLADLETLCAALNKDYVDGTLSDYFADIELKTAWGKQARKEGSDADQPGRFLEKQIETLSPKAADPALPACRELLDYIDEVE